MTGYMKADERREQVVRAARQVLARDGLGAGTLRAVAAEAGVPLGTVHYVFPSKEQLLGAVLEQLTSEMAEAMGRAASAAPDLETAIRESVLVVWRALIEERTGDQVLQYELTMWALRTPGMRAMAHRQYQAYLDLVRDDWAAAAERSGSAPTLAVDQLTRLFLAGIDGLVLQYLALGDATRARADVQALVHLVVSAATSPR